MTVLFSIHFQKEIGYFKNKFQNETIEWTSSNCKTKISEFQRLKYDLEIQLQ